MYAKKGGIYYIVRPARQDKTAVPAAIPNQANLLAFGVFVSGHDQT